MDFDLPDFDPFATRDDNTELETSAQLATSKVYSRGNIVKREFINGLKKEALNELIPILPPPDTDLYIIGNGAGAEIRGKHNNPLAFDFGSFLPHVVRMLGDVGVIAFISTWTMNRQHTKTMLEMLKDGRLSALTVFTDPYFARREAAIANELITGLLTIPNGRYLSFKNHCKILALAAPDGRTCCISGSANLSAQPRAEQYNLSTSLDLYAFYVREFFEAMLSNAKKS